MGFTPPQDSPYYKKINNLQPETKAAVRGNVPVSQNSNLFHRSNYFLGCWMALTARARRAEHHQSILGFRDRSQGKHSKVDLWDGLQRVRNVHRGYKEERQKVFREISTSQTRELMKSSLKNSASHEAYLVLLKLTSQDTEINLIHYHIKIK